MHKMEKVTKWLVLCSRKQLEDTAQAYKYSGIYAEFQPLLYNLWPIIFFAAYVMASLSFLLLFTKTFRHDYFLAFLWEHKKLCFLLRTSARVA